MTKAAFARHGIFRANVMLLQVLQQQLAELETKLVQARTDSKAQVKGHNSGKKELEVSLSQCLPLLPSIQLCFSLGQFRCSLTLPDGCSASDLLLLHPVLLAARQLMQQPAFCTIMFW